MHQNRKVTASFDLVVLLTAVVWLPTVFGCGDDKIARYPVTGTVLVDGRPAEGATVIFYPVGGSEEFQKERPFGVTDANGKFDLRTFQPGDGAPAGEYKVMARWLAPGHVRRRRQWIKTGVWEVARTDWEGVISTLRPLHSPPRWKKAETNCRRLN